MTALRKVSAALETAIVSDMSMGLGSDLMPTSNIEGSDMVSGGAVSLMPTSNIKTDDMLGGAGVALMPTSN